MKLEAGKFYKTRDGHVVQVYNTETGNPIYPIHGAVYTQGQWVSDSWKKGGIFARTEGLRSPFDLVAECKVR